MLKLNRRTEEAFWLDLLPGVRVRMKPVSVAMMILARRSVLSGLGREVDADGKLPPLTDDQHAAVSVGLVSSLVKQGLVEWEGVGDADGNPAHVSAEAIDALLDVVPAFDAFDRLYYTPAVALEAEKNG